MKRYLAMFAFVMAIFLAVSVPDIAHAQASAPPASSGGSFQDFIRWASGDEAVSADQANNHKSYEEWKQFFIVGSCWGCKLFESMASVTLDIGQRGGELFTGSALRSIGTFMGLWTLFQLYKMASPSHANSPSQGIDEIFNRIVLMFIIMAILKMGPFGYIMEGMVLPTMGQIMGSAGSLMSASGSGCTWDSTGGSAAAFAQKGTQLMCAMHQEMGKGLGMGAFLVAEAQWSLLPPNIEILRILGGIIIFLAFGLMMIILPFRLFDALVRIATVSVILPIVVFCYLFKPTRGAVKAAASSVLAAALTFLFTCIAIAIAVKLLTIVAVNPILNNNYDGQTTAGIGPLTGSDFMTLIAAAVGMASMVMQSGNLAAEFAGFQGQMGSAGNVGAGMTTVAAGFAAKQAGGTAGKLVVGGGQAVGSGARYAGGKAMDAVRSAGGGSGIKPGGAGM